MSSESESEIASGSAARYRSLGSKRNRSEEPENGDTPVVKRINTSACECISKNVYFSACSNIYLFSQTIKKTLL